MRDEHTEPDYRPAPGEWTLTAPDGRQWHGLSPLAAASAEQRERVPPLVALRRILSEVHAAEDEAKRNAQVIGLIFPDDSWHVASVLESDVNTHGDIQHVFDISDGDTWMRVEIRRCKLAPPRRRAITAVK